MHKRRADVLRHFKKDVANIAIAWQQYQSEQHHRYSNAALRMQSGQIQGDEQQQLLAHSRAITERLPEDMNPIAVGQNQGGSGVTPAHPAPSGKVLAFPSREIVVENGATATQDERDKNQPIPFSSSTILANNQPQPIAHDSPPSTTAAPIPTDSDGFAENPDAYRVWKP